MAVPAAFENIDRLANVEMRPQGLPTGIVGQLYAIARGDGDPISFRCAQALTERGGEHIALLTGIAGGPLPRGEVDGPIGAAALAHALVQLGCQADVVVPEPMIGVAEGVRTALRANFSVVRDSDARPSDYSAAVTIEKLGRNRRGVVHSIFGAVLSDQTPLADDFIEQLNQEGKLTIGIGDGGNEIGFGAIFDQARSIVPHGADCGCPCGDGLVTSTATEIVFPASVSNFGAYAITSALGVLVDRPLLLASAALITQAVEAAVTAGCLDGGTFEPGRIADDGIPIEGVEAVVTGFRTIATQHFRATPRHA